MKGSIRLVTKKDIDLIYSWRNHPEIRRWMFDQNPLNYERHKNWFETVNQSADLSAVIFIFDDEPVGFCTFKSLYSPSTLEWGFYLSPFLDRGNIALKNIGQKFGEELIDHAFNQLNCHKLFGQVISNNFSSLKFHQKMQFVEEGTLKEHYALGEDYLDVICFGLTRKDWEVRHPSVSES